MPLYWSAPSGETSQHEQDYLLQAVADAKYMINFAVLKSHERNGITVTAKNHFGSLSGGNDNSRKPTTSGYYNLHSRLPLETQAPAPTVGDRTQMAQYRPLVDLNGHAGMGGKTVLYLIDGIYGGKGWAGVPSKWAMAPFNNNWPASLFLSMDQVAIDSVAFDFLSQQWPDLALGNEGVQDYLHEMALANNPPSGTLYDPEHDSVAMTSQGVHEHWNNVTQKQYSRNLGTSDGVELVYLNGSPPAPAALGGVNSDGMVNSTDALIILSADVGINTAQFCPMNCGDVNGDGLVNSTDALIILSFDVGMSVPYPVGTGACPASVTAPAGCNP